MLFPFVFLLLLCGMFSSAFASHGPETYYFPFSKIRNDPAPTTPDSNKWFPIGWHLYVHDVYGGSGGGSYDPATAESDWDNGYLYYLYFRSNWWVNCVILDPIDNRSEWGCTFWRGSGQWTQSDWYTRFLDAAETLKNYTSGQYDIKVYPYLVSKLPGGISDRADPSKELYQLHSAGTWTGIPNFDESTLRGRVQSLRNKSQLGGWILSNEPYGGDDARAVGRRSAAHDYLQYIRSVIEQEDTNLNSHPIWCNIRGNGNYNDDPCTLPDYSYLLDELTYGDAYHSITDFMIDNLYTHVYAPNGQTPDFSKFLPNVQGAVDNLLSPTCGIPIRSQGPTRGYLLKSQGGRETSISYNDGYIHDEELRYVNYGPWINGAQGCIFFTLSKSGYDPPTGHDEMEAFELAERISKEAYYLSKYLLRPDAGINATISSTPESDTYVQFILKDEPNYVPTPPITRRVMLMVCNNSINVNYVTIDFPQSMTIYKVKSFFTEYDWSHDDAEHSVSIGLGGQTARAFIIEFE